MIKLGINTYSYRRELITGRTDILTVLDRISDQGASHAELVPDTPTYNNGWSVTPELIPLLKNKARERNIEFSSYTIGAEFITSPEGKDLTTEEFNREIERVKKEVEIAAELGCPRMRHDVCFRPQGQTDYAQFEKDLPKAAEACGIIADHAAKYGIITSIENHGLHFQGSERVIRLILTVGRENFRATVDVGNFVCVDENPVVAVQNIIGYASMLHIKDFYLRKELPHPSAEAGWAQTPHGYYRRGAIPGCGDVDLIRIAQIVKEAGYDGYAALEYAAQEDLAIGIPLGCKTLHALFGEAN